MELNVLADMCYSYYIIYSWGSACPCMCMQTTVVLAHDLSYMQMTTREASKARIRGTLRCIFLFAKGSEDFAIKVRKNLLAYLALLKPVLLLVVIARVIRVVENLVTVRLNALAKVSRFLEPWIAPQVVDEHALV